MNLVVQFIGAAAILVPFAWMLFGRMGRQDRTYLWLNLVGSILLAIDAWCGHQWGFVLIQIPWAVVAAWGLIKRELGIGANSATG